MHTLKNLSELQKLCEKLKRQGKTLGLITGCFDIVHIGHIELFRFAKKYNDIVIVGLENDKTIKINKGPHRPVFNFKQRAQTLAEVESVDFVFKVNQTFRYNSPRANYIWESVVKKIKPDTIITCPAADKYWKEKRAGAKKFGIKFLPYRAKPFGGSSFIIKKLETEI
jgi:cytidyltransferase-like protein